MPITVLVAVDVSEGRVVRLTRGEPGERTVYGEDPVATALAWQEQGAEWLHVVDLDAAIHGDPGNRRVIERLLEEVRIPAEVSGGIRTLEQIDVWLDCGAARVCVGTRALDSVFLAEAVARFGEAVVPAVDARAGRVRVAGWREDSGETVVEVAERMADAGASRIMFTDIERDGTLLGPNLQAIEEVLGAAGLPVIASGGVSGEGDVRALARLAPRGLEGVIVGKALYGGTLTLDRARAAAAGA